MLRIMRDPNEDTERRCKMAIMAAPYVHAKPTVPTGKKEERQEKAKKAGTGKFKSGKAPSKIIKFKMTE